MNHSSFKVLLGVFLFAGAVSIAQAATLSVGPGQAYATPCQAFAAAADGSTIEINAAGNYAGDVCAITRSNLVIRGVNGRAKIDAAGKNAQGKGIWVIQGNNTTVENIEFSGAKVPDQNGAAIRQEGQGLTIRNCYFHHNEDGILSSLSSTGAILVEFSEFAYNGYGDGQSHNIYINNASRFTLQYSYSHHAYIGHLVKSRAAENYILFNRLSDEATGTASYELEFPNGGKTFVIGNVIQQGPATDNNSLLGYMWEGATSGNPSHELYVVNNTFVNDGPSGNFVNIASSDTTPAVIKNNIFYGPGKITSQASAVQANNLTTTPLFQNQAGYDYRLVSGSPAIDKGADPGTAAGVVLAPAYQYVHPACGQARSTQGAIDIGAYEFNGAGATFACGGTTPAPTPAAASVSLNPASVTGGAASTGTVTLSAAAPAGGASVALTSSNTAAASVPASVAVAAGATSATFSVQTYSVTASASVNISASYGGVTKSAALTVAPAQSSTVSLSALQCSPASLASAAKATCTVTLTAAAPTGGKAVSVASNNGLLTVPASVTVPAGAASAAFSATAGYIATSQSAVVSASLSGVTKTATLSLTAPPSTSVALQSLACTPTTIVRGTSGTCTVTLSAASASSVSVALSISNYGLSLPGSVTVAAGARTANFTFRASSYMRAPVTISATYSGVRKSVTITAK